MEILAVHFKTSINSQSDAVNTDLQKQIVLNQPISPCDQMTVYADKESIVNAIHINFWKAFDHLTQLSDLKAEDAFQLMSKTLN